jgi:hypothetical protein
VHLAGFIIRKFLRKLHRAKYFTDHKILGSLSFINVAVLCITKQLNGSLCA